MKYQFLTVGIVASLLAACGGGSEKTPEVDIIPDGFVLANIEGSEKNYVHQTGSFSVAGVDQAVSIAVDGCGYSINGNDQFVTDATQVSNGDTLRFQIIAPAEYSSIAHCNIMVGGYSTSFSISTKDILDTVHVFYQGERFYRPSEGARPATITGVYLHNAYGGEVLEYSNFSENEIIFVDEMPEAYTASTVDTINNELFFNYWTVINPQLESAVYLDTSPIQFSSAPRYLDESCKGITFSNTNTTEESGSLSIELSGSGSCDHYWVYGGFSETYTRYYHPEVNQTNNVLVAEVADNRNIQSYGFFSTDDFIDGEVVNVSNTQTDFLTAVIENILNEEAHFFIWGFDGQDNISTFKLGGYYTNNNESNAIMNVVDVPVDEYLLTKVKFIERGYPYRVQFQYAYEVLDEIPTTISRTAEPGLFSSLEINFGRDLNLIWTGEGLENYEYVKLQLEGDTASGDKFRWIVTAPNTGELHVPYFSDLEPPNFEGDIYFQLALFNESEDENSYSEIYTGSTLHCYSDECTDQRTF